MSPETNSGRRYLVRTGFQSREIGCYPSVADAMRARTRGPILTIEPSVLPALRPGPDGITRPLGHDWWLTFPELVAEV